jgi:peptidoglycan hydrolase-like protein with peptidoglycan-binding domain
MEPILQQASQGAPVLDLQRLLNTKLTPSPRLAPDGKFGPHTRAAVVRYQDENWLVSDGIVGPSTWNALKGREAFVVRTTCVKVPQPTATTCWAAATAMTLGWRFPVSAPPGVTAANGLPNDSQLDDFPTTTLFNRYYGLTLLAPQSWLPSGLASLIRAHGRLLVNTLWNVTGYLGHAGSPGHYRVFVGIRGTNECATLLIYDPWPPTQGAIYSIDYAKLISDTPTTTYQISYR